MLMDRLISSLAHRVAETRSGADIMVRTAASHLGSVAYRRLYQSGFRPGAIIDIGAYQGEWTREVASIFPKTPALMIEARSEESPHLDRTVAELSDVSYAIAMLGSHQSDAVKFVVSATGSSLFEERSDAPRTYRDIPMRRLDDVIADNPKLKAPFFLKLDVQGAELEVLRGGVAALENSEIVQLEVPFLPYNEGAPTAAEVINFMDASGFAPFDISGFIRPDGINLAQADIIFAKKTSTLRRQFFQFA